MEEFICLTRVIELENRKRYWYRWSVYFTMCLQLCSSDVMIHISRIFVVCTLYTEINSFTLTHTCFTKALLFACYVSYAWCSYVKIMCNFMILPRSDYNGKFFYSLCSMTFNEHVLCCNCTDLIAIATVYKWTMQKVLDKWHNWPEKIRETKLFPWIFYRIFHCLDNNHLNFNEILLKKTA